MWESHYRIHLLKMDNFFKNYKPPFKNDIKVYLAGFISRYLDQDYRVQIQPYLIDEETLNQLIQKHLLKLGQNSLIYFFSKINAEYQMFSLLREKIEDSKIYPFSLRYELKEPARLFMITSSYSKLCGKFYLSIVYEIIYKRIIEIFEILFSYIHIDEIKKILIEIDEIHIKESQRELSFSLEDKDIQNFIENFDPHNNIQFNKEIIYLSSYLNN